MEKLGRSFTCVVPLDACKVLRHPQGQSPLSVGTVPKASIHAQLHVPGLGMIFCDSWLAACGLQAPLPQSPMNLYTTKRGPAVLSPEYQRAATTSLVVSRHFTTSQPDHLGSIQMNLPACLIKTGERDHTSRLCTNYHYQSPMLHFEEHFDFRRYTHTSDPKLMSIS